MATNPTTNNQARTARQMLYTVCHWPTIPKPCDAGRSLSVRHHHGEGLRGVAEPWWSHLWSHPPTFIDVRINTAMQVTNVNGARRTIMQTSENREVGGSTPLLAAIFDLHKKKFLDPSAPSQLSAWAIFTAPVENGSRIDSGASDVFDSYLRYVA
jgi:hypothetical protein